MYSRLYVNLIFNFVPLSLSTDHRKVIGTVVSREDYLVPKAGGHFDAEEYDAHPDRYRSTFAEKVCHTPVANQSLFCKPSQ